MMQERLERRLAELVGEREAGHKVQAELRAQQAELEQTLLRISGAIQVLEELLDEDDDPAADDTADGDAATGAEPSPAATATSSSPVPPRPPMPPPVPFSGPRSDGDRAVARPLGDT
jgi:hypothetical protein